MILPKKLNLLIDSTTQILVDLKFKIDKIKSYLKYHLPQRNSGKNCFLISGQSSFIML